MRIIWDTMKGVTYVAGNGSFNTTSGRLGQVVDALRSADSGIATSARTRFPALHDTAAAAGWLDPSFAFTKVDRGPHLKRMQIEVSLRCNLECSYCYSMSGPARKTALTSDEIRDILRQGHDMGVISVDFTGGEFFLDREWESYVELATRLDMAISLHTNGTTLTPRIVATLARYRPQCVQVSMDSHLAADHDRARGRRGAFALAIRGLDELSNSGIRTRIALMASRENIGTIAETVEYFKQRYPAARLNVDRVVATGGAVTDGNGITAREFWDAISPLRPEGVQTGKVCDSPSADDFEPDCGMAYSYVYITAAGEVAACPTMTSREEARFTGPNIREHTLGDSWYESEFFNSFRGTNCGNVMSCPSGAACGGGCRSNAYIDGGDLHAPDLVACNVNKNPRKAFIDFSALYQNLAAAR